MSAPECILLLDLLLAAVWIDELTGRIPNALIVSGYLCALTRGLAGRDLLQLGSGLAGALIPLALLLPLFACRMIGAGDIKLLSMAGAFIGYPAVLAMLVGTLYAGGAAAAVLLIVRKNAWQRAGFLLDYVQRCLRGRKVLPYMTPADQGGTFHFSLPILIGAVIAIAGMAG